MLTYRKISADIYVNSYEIVSYIRQSKICKNLFPQNIILDSMWIIVITNCILVLLTSSSWWRSVHHWRETGSSSCCWKPSRCSALQCRKLAHHASSATATTTPEEMAVRTQELSVQVSKVNLLHHYYMRGISPKLYPSYIMFLAFYSICTSIANNKQKLALILPKSICFWMVYICSVLSIRRAPSLQLLTNCWNNTITTTT